MSAVIYQLRPFQSARDQAKPLGPGAKQYAVRKIREEQDAGRTGNAIVGELRMLRARAFGSSVPPEGGTAA